MLAVSTNDSRTHSHLWRLRREEGVGEGRAGSSGIRLGEGFASGPAIQALVKVGALVVLKGYPVARFDYVYRVASHAAIRPS